MTQPNDLESVLERAKARGLKLVDTSKTVDEILEEFDRAEFDKQRRLRGEQMLEDLVPKRFRHDVPLPPQIATWLCKFWSEEERDADFDNGRNGLVLAGRPGCGKTHAVWQVLKDLMSKGWTDFRFWIAEDLFDELTLRSTSKRTDKDVLDPLGSVDLLVLDDLGAKKLTEFREVRLLSILDERYRRKLPTIITTNVGPGRFSEFFGGRNASRIAGMCDVVTFPDVDHRNTRRDSAGIGAST